MPIRTKKSQSGATLVEYVFAVAIGAVVTLAIVALMIHSGRTFASLANVAALNSSSVNAIDRMTKEIRNSMSVAAFEPSKIVLNVSTNETLTFAYSASNRVVTRQFNSGAATPLIADCDSFDLFIYEPGVQSNTLALPTAGAFTNAKAIGVTWLRSREILGKKVNNDQPKTAIVVMRKP